jgi:hypothetical protein
LAASKPSKQSESHMKNLKLMEHNYAYLCKHARKGIKFAIYSQIPKSLSHVLHESIASGEARSILNLIP